MGAREESRLTNSVGSNDAEHMKSLLGGNKIFRLICSACQAIAVVINSDLGQGKFVSVGYSAWEGGLWREMNGIRGEQRCRERRGGEEGGV